MNAITALTALDADRYLVEFPGDGIVTVVSTAEEARHEIVSTDIGYGPQPFRVTFFNAAEGWSRDVTMDFTGPDDEPDDDAGFAAYRAHKRWERDVTPRRL